MALTTNGLCGLVAASAVAFGVAPVAAATDAVRPPWKNCTQVHTKYPHGVGKASARDKTSGVPVTTFRRSTRLYNIAMNNNKGLDRDKDGIACEQR